LSLYIFRSSHIAQSKYLSKTKSIYPKQKVFIETEYSIYTRLNDYEICYGCYTY